MRPSRYRPLPLLVGLVLASGTLGGSSISQAEPAVVNDVIEPIAAALYDRGMALYEQGDVANAKKMFSESLGRSPEGSRAADALRMLRECNEKLGVQDLDSGRPKSTNDGPLDPYGEVPMDPYADGTQGGANEAPIDPYANPGPVGQGGAGPLGPQDTDEDQAGRIFVAHGALQGFIAGMAVLGPYEEDDVTGELGSIRGSSVVLGLASAGAAGYLSYYIADKKQLTETQGNVIGSSGFWGMYNGAHLGNIFGGESSDANDIYMGMALTGLAGTGFGYWYATSKNPNEGELAYANSLTLYGTSGGLFLGVAMDPPRGDAYSLNAVLGSAAGLGLTYYTSDKNITRSRMLRVDIGAAVGAVAPWILIYPFMADSTTNDDEQLAGLFSVIGIAGGGYAAWRYTEGDAKSDTSEGETARGMAAPPALVQRSEGGSWSLATPAIRPMDMPALAPKRGISFGSDLLSGRF